MLSVPLNKTFLPFLQQSADKPLYKAYGYDVDWKASEQNKKKDTENDLFRKILDEFGMLDLWDKLVQEVNKYDIHFRGLV